MGLESFLRRVYRKFFPAKAQERVHYAQREESWQAFLKEVEPWEKKLQVGVRNEKYAPDWVSVDLFDKSELIDYNYDIQNLPFDAGSFDAIVCNAVLEHVPYPELAIYEFFRVLKPGGYLWLEVPFMTPYHAHPYDYSRVTLPGLKRWSEDFQEKASGIFEGFAFEAEVFHKLWAGDLGLDAKESRAVGEQIRNYVKEMEEKHGVSEKVYMATFIWLQKPETGEIGPEKSAYMEFLKRAKLQP